MQIALRRLQVFVSRELLGHNGIACVLCGPRAELVAQGVPNDPFVASPIEPGELEEFPPHAAEILLAAAGFCPEDVRFGIVAQGVS